MDSTAQNVSLVVAILTAILSDQEEITNQLIVEANPLELFSCMTGILLSALHGLAEVRGKTVQSLLQDIGIAALKNS